MLNTLHWLPHRSLLYVRGKPSLLLIIDPRKSELSTFNIFFLTVKMIFK